MAIERTHRIAIYDPPAASEDPYVPSDPMPTLIQAGIPANLQPLTGNVAQTAAGRTVDATWRGFVPPEYGALVKEDRLVYVESGVGPEVYRIRQAGEQGGRWDTEMLLGVTAERIPEEVRP